MAEKKNEEERPTPQAMLSMLEIAGKRIEALDRSMMTIRQLYFVVLGILAAGFTNVMRGLDLDTIVLLVDAGTLIVCGLAVVLWQLDSHYHQYLYEAVKTSVTLEKRLGFNSKNKMGLATNLEKWREDSGSGSVIPAKLYFLPAMLGLVSVASIAMLYGFSFGPENSIYQISVFAAFGSLFIIIMWLLQIRESIPK